MTILRCILKWLLDSPNPMIDREYADPTVPARTSEEG